jgi:hypothetical protein
VAENFGLLKVGSVEMFWEVDVWWVRGFSGADRTGALGGGATAADTNLGVVVLSTLPTILAASSLQTTGKWHIDRDAHSIAYNVAPLREGAASVDISPGEVDALLDLEAEWAGEGVGAVTPRG